MRNTRRYGITEAVLKWLTDFYKYEAKYCSEMSYEKVMNSSMSEDFIM